MFADTEILQDDSVLAGIPSPVLSYLFSSLFVKNKTVKGRYGPRYKRILSVDTYRLR